MKQFHRILREQGESVLIYDGRKGMTGRWSQKMKKATSTEGRRTDLLLERKTTQPQMKG